MGKTYTRGVGLVAFGEAVQTYEEKFWVGLIDGSITEIFDYRSMMARYLNLPEQLLIYGFH